jgi:hypothetical protein
VSKKKELKIAGAEIEHPAPVPRAEAAAQVPEGGGPPPLVAQPLRLSVDVQNPTDKPLHVWATRRHYEYNPETRVLSVYLTDDIPPPPPGIEIVSNHPRTPHTVEVNPGGSATVQVPVPSVYRRRVPGEGLGQHFVEERIEQVDRVELHIQASPEPVKYSPGEHPEEHRKRMKAQGQVVHTTVTPTEKRTEPYKEKEDPHKDKEQ